MATETTILKESLLEVSELSPKITKMSSINEKNEIHHSLPEHLGPDPRLKKRSTMATVAGVAGNVMEWYDFAVFGYFSDVIGDVFFPPQAGHAAIAESFAVFGGAFIMRPIGGMIMGYIGDTYGRKKALELSIFLMAFPTFAMGCLPSYDQVGWMSIVLLTVVRLMQGLSVGGQLMSSLVYTIENAPRNRWGLHGSYVMSAANCGTLLGGIVGYVLTTFLDDDQLHSWGWRLPFLAGILVSLSGLYLKYCVEEDSAHLDHLPEGAEVENPIKTAFSKKNRRSLMASALVPMLWSGGFYLCFVWMAIFMKDLVPGAPVPGAFAINSFSLFFSLCLTFPLSGLLSDYWGRKPVMILGASLMCFTGPVMVILISNGNPYIAFLAQSALGIYLALWGAPMMAWLAESFPPEARLTAVSIGYNIAQAIAGGTSPVLATVLVDQVGAYAPGAMLTVYGLLGLVGLYIAPAPIESIESRGIMHIGDTENTVLQ